MRLDPRGWAIFSDDFAQNAADFAERCFVLNGFNKQWHQCLGTVRRQLDPRQQFVDLRAIALLPYFAESAYLLLLDSRVNAEQVNRHLFVNRELVDADDDLFLTLDGFLIGIRRLLDFLLDVTR